MSAPGPNDSKQAWVDHAVAEGLDEEEAEGFTRDELAEMFTPEVEYQDQGSLDEPVQSTEPVEAAADVGTDELRDDARERVRSGQNRAREPFPWEGPPPRSR